MSKRPPAHLSVHLLTCLSTRLTVYLSVLRGGMDSHPDQDPGGNAHVLLLHLWSDDPSRSGLLAERLEEAAGVHLHTSLPVLRLQLVSPGLLCSVIGQSRSTLCCHWSGASTLFCHWSGDSCLCFVIGQVISVFVLSLVR